jgi:hypothetical protein
MLGPGPAREAAAAFTRHAKVQETEIAALRIRILELESQAATVRDAAIEEIATAYEEQESWAYYPEQVAKRIRALKGPT